MSDISSQGASFTKTDYVSQQVEGHLILGPLARGNKTGALIIVVTLCLIASKSLLSNLSVGAVLDWVMMAAMLIWSANIFLKMPKDLQARRTWWLMKIMGGVLSFIFLLCSLVLLLQGKRDGWFFLAIGAIWMPGPEFIPKLIPRQKYVTIARFLLMGLACYEAAKAGIFQ